MTAASISPRMPPNPPRNHHFVPVFYLKRWVGADRKLFEWTRRGDHIFRRKVHPKGTAFRRDLYTIGGLPEPSRQWFESTFLQQTDNLASAALTQMLAGGSLDVNTKSGWSRFMMTLGFRHPDGLPELLAMIDRIWNYTGQLPEYESVRQIGDPRTFQEFRDALPLEVRAMIQANLLKGGMDNEIVGQRLNNMSWRVFNLADAGLSLLTSDWPIELGFGTERSLISIPVSPHQAILGSESDEFLRAIARRPPAEIVKVINKFVVTHARQFVFSYDEHHRAFIEKRMGMDRPQPPLFPSLARLFTGQ